MEMIEALEKGEIKYEEVIPEKLAVVISKHRAATSIGYCLAPVVIALNPEFPWQEEKIKKYTICQYEPKYVDLKKVFEELSEIEPGWGGPPQLAEAPKEKVLKYPWKK